jgi:STE24 endopeptidase
MDLLKGFLISAVLGGFLLGLFLSLILRGGRAWWFWAWMIVGIFELLMIWLYPVLLAPLFNKFEPVQNQELIQRIRNLMVKAGLRAKGVFQMDASKRSRHTNAYFTGLGKSKRIVLFDTLLQSHSSDEIEAVLAHEVGHWKRKHVLKHLVAAEALSLAGFFLLSRLLHWQLLYETFGFRDLIPYAGLFLAGVLFSPLGFFARPLESFFSRKFEREADDFVLRLLPSGEPLADALKRLSLDNLSNLRPHPLYAWFYYSHPPIVERILRLKNRAS